MLSCNASFEMYISTVSEMTTLARLVEKGGGGEGKGEWQAETTPN